MRKVTAGNGTRRGKLGQREEGKLGQREAGKLGQREEGKREMEGKEEDHKPELITK